MDRAQRERLMERFEAQLVAFERLRGFIEGCHARVGRFRPEVVNKVVADYEAACLEVVGAIGALQPDLEGELQILRLKRTQLSERAEEHQLAVDELELRWLIGEISEEAHDASNSEHLAYLQETSDTLQALELEIEAMAALLTRWVEVGQAAGVLKAA